MNNFKNFLQTFKFSENIRKSKKYKKDKKPKTPELLGKLFLKTIEEVDMLLANSQFNKLYIPNSGFWHSPAFSEKNKFKKCRICLAGALIAQTIQNPRIKYIPQGIENQSLIDKNKLSLILAIDAVRCGFYECAYRIWRKKRTCPEKIKNKIKAKINREACMPIKWENRKEWIKSKPLLIKRGKLLIELGI